MAIFKEFGKTILNQNNFRNKVFGLFTKKHLKCAQNLTQIKWGNFI